MCVQSRRRPHNLVFHFSDELDPKWSTHCHAVSVFLKVQITFTFAFVFYVGLYVMVSAQVHYMEIPCNG